MSETPKTAEPHAEPALGAPLPLIRRLPILGYIARITDEERVGEIGLLLTNVVMAAVLLVLLFGLQAFVPIVYAVLVVVGSLVFAASL